MDVSRVICLPNWLGSLSGAGEQEEASSLHPSIPLSIRPASHPGGCHVPSPEAGSTAPRSSASRAASPDRSVRPEPAASWLPCRRRGLVLDVECQRPVGVRLHGGQHRRVDQVAVDRVFDQQLGLAVIHRHRPERVHRRQLAGGKRQRVVVLAAVERLTVAVDASSSDRSPRPHRCRRCPPWRRRRASASRH